MTDWDSQANEIFADALEIDSPSEREALLQRRSAGDVALRARVDHLIEAHQQAGSQFLDQPTMPPDPAATESSISEQAGSRIGPYKLLEQIGEGGMGVVFLAEQTEPVRRRVALKIVKAGMNSGQVIARFEAERQALAIMDHPNIARVLDAGTTETGRPYFVMELVKGIPITQFCNAQRLSAGERIELYLPVCQAVQHAHQKGIIHRDLKPSNVLVAMYDDRPVPKVIDFGIAKATGEQLTERTLFTSFGQVIGTLEYMSPEQAQLNQLDVDTRSDVYALGVMLYELLTGTTPLDRERIKTVAMLEVLRLISEEEAPPPSRRLSSSSALAAIAAARRTDPARLPALLRGDLDWIVLKSLEKDRKRRYESAGALANDLDRFLSDLPVEAHPPSVAYRLRKLARRHRGPLIAAALLLLLLTGGGVATAWQAIRATRAEGAAKNRLTEAVAAKRHADRAREAAITAQQSEERQRRQAETALQAAERNLYFNQIALADRHWKAHDLERAETILEACPPQFRSWEWRYLMHLCRGNVLTEHGYIAAFSPDGNELAFAQSRSGTLPEIVLWHTGTKSPTTTIKLDADAVVSLAYSPNGQLLAAVCGEGDERFIHVRDRATQQVMATLELGPKRTDVVFPSVEGMAFSPDSDTLVAAISDFDVSIQQGQGMRVHRWNLATGEVDWESPDVGFQVAFSETGERILALKRRDSLLSKLLAPGSSLAVVELDAVTGQALRETPIETSLRLKPLNSATFSFDAKHIAFVEVDQITVVDVCTGKVRHVLQHESWPSCLDFDREARRLAVGYYDGTIALWDLSTSTVVRQYVAHEDSVSGVAFQPHGGYFVSGGQDGNVRLWDSRNEQRWQEVPRDDPWALEVRPDGSQYAVISRGAGIAQLKVELRRASDGDVIRQLARLPIPRSRWGETLGDKFAEAVGLMGTVPPLTITYSRDGQKLAAAIAGSLRVWDVTTGKETAQFAINNNGLYMVLLDPQGRRLAALDGDEILVWDLESKSQLRRFAARENGRSQLHSRAFAFSPDGTQLVVASDAGAAVEVMHGGARRTIVVRDAAFTLEGRIEWWDVATGASTRSWPLTSNGSVLHMAISSDGRRLATVDDRGRLQLWNTESGELLQDLPDHNAASPRVAFTPDGQRLVSATFSAAKLWDVHSGQEIFSFDFPNRNLRLLEATPAFDSSGRYLTVSPSGFILDAGSGLK